MPGVYNNPLGLPTDWAAALREMGAQQQKPKVLLFDIGGVCVRSQVWKQRTAEPADMNRLFLHLKQF